MTDILTVLLAFLVGWTIGLYGMYRMRGFYARKYRESISKVVVALTTHFVDAHGMTLPEAYDAESEMLGRRTSDS